MILPLHIQYTDTAKRLRRLYLCAANFLDFLHLWFSQALQEQLSALLSIFVCQTPFQLENPTQLWLVWVGVDFVFPRRKEGRSTQSNPHQAFSRENNPICLIFGDCLVAVWRVYGNCLEGVWQVSFCCLDDVLRVSGRCLKGVWTESMGCLNGILVSQDWWSQDRSSQDRSSYDRSTQDRAIKDRFSRDKSSWNCSSQDWSS